MKICLVLYKYGVDLQDPCCYPLGFMYVSSYFMRMGHRVKVLNYNLWGYDFKSEIKDQDMVCFTGFEEFKSNILRDSQIAREMGKKVCVGGALATFGGIDEFYGLKFGGEIEKFTDINRITWPDYEGFGINEYHKRHSLNYMGVLTSRGCPYSCTFCAQTCEFKMRSLPYVFDEIDEYIGRYKLDMIVFNDNTLNINKKRFMEICSRIKVPWTGGIRCQPFDEEMAKAAKDSNCRYLVVGVESFRQDKLNMMNKKIKVEQIIRTLNLLHKYDIDYHGNILVGFENESMQEITNEILEMPMQYKVFPALVQPFVGTKNGHSRKIKQSEVNMLSGIFEDYVKSSEKTCYPQLDQLA